MYPSHRQQVRVLEGFFCFHVVSTIEFQVRPRQIWMNSKNRTHVLRNDLDSTTHVLRVFTRNSHSNVNNHRPIGFGLAAKAFFGPSKPNQTPIIHFSSNLQDEFGHFCQISFCILRIDNISHCWSKLAQKHSRYSIVF